ncbi:MAG: M50 family metallopeptidase [Clostridia bacterium]|nr:M50 family metallopeptidase [Clostridia bacterium]
MYVILALLLLGVLIIAHEFGHYIAARLCGIDVVEFAMGMGPLLLKWTNKRGTQFSLRLLPIGGFCQFYGEEDGKSDERAFTRQPVWKRFVTVLSGPMMNFVIAVLVIVLYMSALGLLAVVPKVAEVEPAAEASGLRVGDEIVAIDGEAVSDSNQIAQMIGQSQGEKVSMRVRRDGEEIELSFTPFYDEELGRYRLGMVFAQERVRVSLLESIPFSVRYNIESVAAIVDALKGMVFRGEGVDQVTGPVGTVYAISSETQSGGIDIYLQLLALISVNLGVMNLLPIPGLDGSKLLFLLAEKLRRRPIRQELEGMINAGGLLLLMGLMIVLTYKDIMQIFVR